MIALAANPRNLTQFPLPLGRILKGTFDAVASGLPHGGLRKAFLQSVQLLPRMVSASEFAFTCMRLCLRMATSHQNETYEGSSSKDLSKRVGRNRPKLVFQKPRKE